MQRILIPGPGGGLLVPRRREFSPLPEGEDTVAPPREKTEWDKLRERSNAMRLIADVEAKAAPVVEGLKKLDVSGEGDAFPEKGQAGYANKAVQSPGLGFNSTVTEQHDAYLKYDVDSGTVQEFRQRVVRDGEESELAIVKDGDDTVYSRTQGTWREIAIAHADGTYSSEKQIRISPEMQEMLKLKLAMQLAGGGGAGEESPFG
jgi:hypothetical protein